MRKSIDAKKVFKNSKNDIAIIAIISRGLIKKVNRHSGYTIVETNGTNKMLYAMLPKLNL